MVMTEKLRCKDKDALWFYRIETVILSFVFLLALAQHEWLGSLIPVGIMLTFLIGGPPVIAVVESDQRITFRGPIRRSVITPESLSEVKDAAANDYRAHIVLKNRRGFRIMYRCRKYENSSELANAVLQLLEKAPNAKVTDDALKLLRRVAQGKTKPIPG